MQGPALTRRSKLIISVQQEVDEPTGLRFVMAIEWVLCTLCDCDPIPFSEVFMHAPLMTVEGGTRQGTEGEAGGNEGGSS